jgi:hypothetical protein
MRAAYARAYARNSQSHCAISVTWLAGQSAIFGQIAFEDATRAPRTVFQG